MSSDIGFVLQFSFFVGVITVRRVIVRPTQIDLSHLNKLRQRSGFQISEGRLPPQDVSRKIAMWESVGRYSHAQHFVFNALRQSHPVFQIPQFITDGGVSPQHRTVVGQTRFQRIARLKVPSTIHSGRILPQFALALFSQRAASGTVDSREPLDRIPLQFARWRDLFEDGAEFIDQERDAESAGF
jgi:hypothetical protein